jgi:hypothetical protein
MSFNLNDETYIYGTYFDFPGSEDFEDRCIVFNAGDELAIVNGDGSPRRATIFGYFYDVP